LKEASGGGGRKRKCETSCEKLAIIIDRGIPRILGNCVRNFEIPARAPLVGATGGGGLEGGTGTSATPNTTSSNNANHGDGNSSHENGGGDAGAK
jgi:hypothetical protein